MISSFKRSFPILAMVGLGLMAGCAGANVNILANNARFPISMSPVVRDQSGVLLDGQSLARVGEFEASSTKFAILYSMSSTGTFDISEAVNQQVAAAGGEAIVNFKIRADDGCTLMNTFPILNILPFWPGCIPVTVTGDIVRRAQAPTYGAPPPPR
jgi:hypothetical protein